MSKWLLTGGAGYIGSHVIQQLLKANIEVCVVDDLSTGLKERLPDSVNFYQGTLLNQGFLENIFKNESILGVIHLAAKKSVGESMLNPNYYYEENVLGLLNLIKAMNIQNVKNIVYSSSAAVYGEPLDPLVNENSLTVPTSVYGETKLIGEWIIKNSNLNSISLRYFNVAGAGDKNLGDTAADNVIPKVFKALSENRTPEIFGDDYSTFDGTCLRDYVHVVDLAKAHVLAANALIAKNMNEIYNVGTGNGFSVKQLFEQIQKSTNNKFDYKISTRRPGDPAATVADVKKINKDLDFQTKLGLSEIVDSAWQAWQFRVNQK
jgi:UDP-glucose 4-epimerase